MSRNPFTRNHFHFALGAVAAGLLVGGLGWPLPSQAQIAVGRAVVAPQAPSRVAAPNATSSGNAALPGAPSANGLPSPVAPQSANSLPSPFTPSAPSLNVPGTSAAGTVAAGAPIREVPPGGGTDASTTNTAVMGAGPYGSRGMARPAQAGPLTDVEIARAFLMADANRDGELSRAEATRLSIMPLAFEEMDANHDDRLTRSEYEGAVR